jgi:Ca2+-binding RTX toxin-like protein
MAASTYLAQVQQLYIAYFGRPADPIGQAYWAGIIDAANGSIAAVQAGFSASTESQALYGNKSTIDKVTAIYNNVFNRAPDAAGLAFWVAQIDSGKVSQAQASWTIQQNAGAGDAATVQNKLTAAQAFTAQIDTAAEIQGYQGTGASDAGRAFLNTVTSVNATATAAVAAAPSAVATAVNAGGTGSSFALTAGVDNLTGTSSNDVFTADNTGTNPTGTAADTINGGAGVDTLRIFQASGATTVSAPTITNIENVLINGGAVIAGGYTAITGTTGLIIEAPATIGSTYTVAGQTVTLKGSAGVGTTTIASTADTAANVTLNGWGTGATSVVDLSGTKVVTATLNATGANSSIALTDTGAALKTLNITGDRAVTVVTPAGLTSVNASAATGAVSVDGSAAAAVAAFAFTGGAGNDTLTLRAGDLGTLTAGSQLDGGAGTDTLVLKDLTLAGTDYTKLNAVKGFETLSFAGASASVDASQLTSIKAFVLAGATSTDVISNLGAGSTVAINGAVTTSLTLGAVTGNTATDVTIGTATTAGLNVVSLTTTGLTTLSLTSNGTAGNTIGTLVNSDNSTITIKGSADLVITNALAGTTTGSKVDASAFTGKLTITGSGQNDIIIGGTGDDTITGGAGADTLTGGAGKDKFILSAGATAATADTITDFVTKVDTIVLGATAGSVTNFKAATAAVATFDLAKTAADAIFAADTTTAFSAQQVGSDTYVFFAATASNATEQIVKLTGVSLTNVAATDFLAA